MDYADLDPLDRQIVTLLQEDGRMAFREMARRLSVSEGTIRRRYNAMVRDGLLQVLATGDPAGFGIKVDAISLVKTIPREAEAAAKAIAALEEVRFVGLAMGPADIVVESLHASIDELYQFISHTLPDIPGISGCETIQVVRILKNTWDWKAWLKREPVEEVKV
jgi:Lrp/AsnC family transcriptional regulator, regulator for asnA, asnC and gidA